MSGALTKSRVRSRVVATHVSRGGDDPPGRAGTEPVTRLLSSQRLRPSAITSPCLITEMSDSVASSILEMDGVYHRHNQLSSACPKRKDTGWGQSYPSGSISVFLQNSFVWLPPFRTDFSSNIPSDSESTSPGG